MSLEKLKILLWKNWILQKRRPISGILQIAFPLVIVIIIAVLKNKYKPKTPLSEDFEIENVILMKDFSKCKQKLTKIYYYPNFEAYKKFIDTTFDGLGFEIKGFKNHTDLPHWKNRGNDVVTIRIDPDQLEGAELPKSIRNLIDFEKEDLLCEAMFQNQLERTFIELNIKSKITFETRLMKFPYVDAGMQIYAALIATILPLFLILSMFLMVVILVKEIVAEKESKMKEMMKIMGLRSTINWLSWFIKFMIIATIVYTLITLILCLPIFGDSAVFQHANIILVWIFFLFYLTSVITFCFLISTFFTKTSTASYIGIMLFFTTFVPFYAYSNEFENFDYAIKWLYLLPVNTAFAQGILMIFSLDLIEIGVNFSNIFTQHEGFGFSFGEIMITLLLSAVIHTLLTLYIEKVFPGDLGVPQPWHFPITGLIRKIRNKSGDNAYCVTHTDNKFSSDDFEEEPKHLDAKVRIANLTKKYGSFTAVNNLSLNMYGDQITVLLGHNGGGKTTTMNVLTGMIPPTHGTAFINDYDIRVDTADAQKSLGICPQHDVLFDNLTVREHIIFFCRLKGMTSNKNIDDEVDKYINMMDFADKKNKLAKTLSGGQKRKLGVANALCGNSQFVVLDEPSSGLDVNARRNLWNLLMEQKKNRTILLTTHYMDEAEVLGDRIAIMSDGILKTVGTSYFLKKKYGSGYRLVIVKGEKCDSMKILEGIKMYAHDSVIDFEEQLEVSYVLSEEYVDKFYDIFKHLEDNLEELGIQSLGCSLATLEDVFLQFGDEKVQMNNETTIKFNSVMSFTEVSPICLALNQFYAMILKKIHFTRRNYVPLIIWTLLSSWFFFVFLFEASGTLNVADVTHSKLSGLLQGNDSDTAIIGIYRDLFNGSQLEFTRHENMNDFIRRSFMKRNQKYKIGANFDQNIVWFSSFFDEALFPALNFYHRAILKEKAGLDYDISSRYPFETDEFYNLRKSFKRGITDVPIYMLMFLLLMFWTVFHISLKIKERTTKFKLIQFIRGVNRSIFTLTSLLIDSTMSLVILFAALGIIFSVGRDGFKTIGDLFVYLLSYTLYVFNIIPLIYVMAFWFKKPATGEAVASIMNFVFGLFFFQYTLASGLFHSLFYGIGVLFAPFSILNIFAKMLEIIFQYRFREDYSLWSFGNYGFGTNLVCMGVGGLIFLTFVLLKDYNIFRHIRHKCSGKKNISFPATSFDEDVRAEYNKIHGISVSQAKSSNLLIKDLSKSYKEIVAVNQLNLNVESGECFGLLGVNGAGKTSVFKMLTGDEIITSGEVRIKGHNLVKETSKAYQEIGYCPQYDALIDELTGRETLKIFCLINGVPNDQIKEITETFADELDFTKYLDVKVGNYSGGNKRKLSTSLALLGNSSLIFLDECSSGIDPRARRQLWNAIKKVKIAGKSIVMSSHSMQECESLCTRLAIMVDGRLRCIGSIQHIKNKFAKGFILKIMLSRRNDENLSTTIKNTVLMQFPGAELTDNFMGLLTFHINQPRLKWSEVFAELSKMKQKSAISDYTLTQSSLESVFLSFTQSARSKLQKD